MKDSQGIQFRARFTISTVLVLLTVQASAADPLPTVHELIANQRDLLAGLESIQYTCRESLLTGAWNSGTSNADRELEYTKEEEFVGDGEKYRYTASATNASNQERMSKRTFAFDGEHHYQILSGADGSTLIKGQLRDDEISAQGGQTIPSYFVPFARNMYQGDDWTNHGDLQAGRWLVQEEAWRHWATQGTVIGREDVDGLNCTVLRVRYAPEPGKTDSPGHALIYLADNVLFFPVLTKGYEFIHGEERLAVRMSATGLDMAFDESGKAFPVFDAFDVVQYAVTGRSIAWVYTFDKDRIRFNEPIRDNVFRLDSDSAELAQEDTEPKV